MTTLSVRTTIDTSKLDTAGKQTAFAMSKAINAVLLKAQTAERTRMAQTFTIRRKQFAERAVKITQFAKKTTLVGEIAIAPPGDRADIFAKFEAGGTKRPKDGHSLAIPVTGSPVKRTAKSVVADKNRPRALLSNAQTVQSRGKTKQVKRAKSFGGAFLRPAKDGKPGAIFIRTPKGLQLAYILEPSAPLKPELHFTDTVTATVTKEWVPTFEQEFAHALATAKK